MAWVISPVPVDEMVRSPSTSSPMGVITAAVLSAALMLDHLGLTTAAKRVEEAVHAQLSDWARSGQGQRLSTAQRGDAFTARVGTAAGS